MADTTAPTSEASAAKPEKKSTWETIITMTPVIMTVIATLLAGLSTSEMTKAQYHRSLAAQNQSKAGDQWGFFQAKAVRRTLMESAVDQLPVSARPGPLTPELLRASVVRLARTLADAQAKAVALQKAAAAKNMAQLAAAADETARELAKARPEVLLEALDGKPGKPGALETNKEVFAFLGTGKLPEPANPPSASPEFKTALEDEKIKAATKALGDRKSDRELAPVVRDVKPDTLSTALHGAELQALAFEKASDPIGDKIKDLAKTISVPLRQAANFHKLTVIADGSTAASADAGPELQDALKQLNAADVAVRNAADDLNQLFRAAQQDYDARRYRAESRNNLNTALLYEVQVHRSSANSDAHVKRSGFFFFGMLGAQCGVVIGTIALAARRKSVLWLLAAIAGLAAIGFSAYVYLSM